MNKNELRQNKILDKKDTLPVNTPPPVSLVKVAALQYDMQVGMENKKFNVEESVRRIHLAADDGARLIVLPELCNTGYTFETRENAYAHAETVPDGPTCAAWIAAAAERDVYIVAGITESDTDGIRLYDTAVLIGPDGFIGKYRKAHLWNKEKLWFTPGDNGFPVFETKLGRIGLLICWDIWFPEVPRILANQGADIICSVNNWVWTPPPLFDRAGNCMATYLTMAAAHQNNIPIVAADRIGSEPQDAKFLGCSVITGANGWPLGEIASAEEEEVLYAEIDISATRQAMIWNDLNDLVRDRRVDLYDSMLGYTQAPAIPR